MCIEVTTCYKVTVVGQGRKHEVTIPVVNGAIQKAMPLKKYFSSYRPSLADSLDKHILVDKFMENINSTAKKFSYMPQIIVEKNLKKK